MKLDINFDHKLERIINLCEPLADWFLRNQESMAYFEFTHKGCTRFDDEPTINHDIKVLGKMANAGLTWLESSANSPEEKAINAALAIASVYEEEKELLSEVARSKYYIDVQGLQKEKASGRSL